VLYPTQVFGAGFDWLSALAATVIVCALGGAALKQGLAYWIALGAVTVIGAITGLVVSLFNGG